MLGVVGMPAGAPGPQLRNFCSHLPHVLPGRHQIDYLTHIARPSGSAAPWCIHQIDQWDSRASEALQAVHLTLEQL
jgi:hypothetical protein